jgi:phosphonoacetaldehyde hydrolase
MFTRISNLKIINNKAFNRTLTNGAHFRNPNTKRPYKDTIKTVILDNSGTCVDPFVIAPAVVFQEVFKQHNIDISMREARIPMGLRKDLHISEILKLPRIQEEFIKVNGRKSTKDDVATIFNDFVPMQIDVLPKYCTIMPNVLSTMDNLRDQGIKFGTTTGFNREMVNCILENTKDKGLHFDTTMAGDDFPEEELHLGARPKPFMVWKNLFKLDAWPIESVIKVDDTITGIQEGINAGCWSIGITDYSNYMDIDTIEEWNSMSSKEKQKRKEYSRDKIQNESGAHYIINEFDELELVIQDINQRLSLGEKP